MGPKMQREEKEKWANALTEARISGKPLSQISNRVDSFGRSDAYEIQEIGISHREQMGEKVIGLKMGLTSEAKRRQMDLDSPLYGALTDKMQIENGGTFSLKGSIHPKIEPEIAFHIARAIEGKPTREDVLSACSGIYAALEILDSRYDQFKYFSMEDVISDNSSSSHFILGPKLASFNHLDLKNLEIKMMVNREVVQQGFSHAISGDPVTSVIQLCELLAERGKRLEGDSIVLAGAATQAVALETGMEIGLEVEGLSPLNVMVSD